MADLSAFATGLSNAISGYLQKNQDQQRQQQNKQFQTGQDLQEYAGKKQIDQDFDQGQANQVTPDMAEQLIPGSGKWVSNFSQQNNRLPSIDEVNKGLTDVVTKLQGIQAKNSNSTTKTADMSNKQLATFQKSYNSDKVISTEKQALAAADTANDQIHLAVSNPVAYSSVPITLARMMTGTSRINQQEIQRLGGSQAIMDRANQIGKQMASGTVTQDNAQWMEGLVQTLHNSHQTNIENRTAELASQYRQLSGDDLPTAWQKVTGQQIPDRFTKKPSETVPPPALEEKKAALRKKLGL